MQEVNENGVVGGWTGCFFVKAEPTGNNTANKITGSEEVRGLWMFDLRCQREYSERATVP